MGVLSTSVRDDADEMIPDAVVGREAVPVALGKNDRIPVSASGSLQSSRTVSLRD